MALRSRGATPNVSLASGDLFPNGVGLNPANPDVQATVRPYGWLFRPSAGFSSVGIGAHRLDLAHPHGQGIDFSPIRLAEDLAHDPPGPQGPPLLVQPGKTGTYPGDRVDLADVPGSQYLDGEGKLPADLADENRGMYLTDREGGPPTGGPALHEGRRTIADMGDRDPLRPLSREAAGFLRHPVGAFQSEWAEDPVKAVAAAAIIVGLVYMITSNFERSYRSRRGRGVAGAVGAAPAAAAETTGRTVAASAATANTALTSAGDAVKSAVSAAGDAVEAAGDAVEKTTEAAADAVKTN